MAVNVLISIFGVIPSVFLTAANLIVFGFWEGTFISFIGEAVGAAIAFLVYRKGFQRVFENKLSDYPRVKPLLDAKGKKTFLLILSLRIMPLIPSGVVTLAAAISQVSLALFVTASTIGKAPALLLEAYSVNEMTRWTTNGKVILGLCSVLLLVISLKKWK
ncbi:MAG TPA: VTT domain-containing protein [Anoxybacillus sp.]|nr:VTT domain-containing protein [Anoxybacillus sp.]